MKPEQSRQPYWRSSLTSTVEPYVQSSVHRPERQRVVHGRRNEHAPIRAQVYRPLVAGGGVLLETLGTSRGSAITDTPS